MQCLDPIADPGNVGSGVAREDGIEAGRCPLRYHGVGHGTDEAGWLSQCHGLTGFRLTLYTCTQHSTVSVPARCSSLRCHSFMDLTWFDDHIRAKG